MTYKQKLEEQLQFARQRMSEASDIDRTREVDTWNGYRQGLKYALAELEGYGYPKEPAVHPAELKEYISPMKKVLQAAGVKNVVLTKQCTCDEQDLRPLGECICGASKVAPV